MTALDAFLYGMPAVLVAGGIVTLYFARRAAAEIASHASRQTHAADVAAGTRVAAPRRPPTGQQGGEAV